MKRRNRFYVRERRLLANQDAKKPPKTVLGRHDSFPLPSSGSRTSSPSRQTFAGSSSPFGQDLLDQILHPVPSPVWPQQADAGRLPPPLSAPLVLAPPASGSKGRSTWPPRRGHHLPVYSPHVRTLPWWRCAAGPNCRCQYSDSI